MRSYVIVHHFLKLYTEHHRLLCRDNMEGARLIYNWLYREAAMESFITSHTFQTPAYLDNYNTLELAKIISDYRTTYNLESLSLTYNAITYYLILEAIPCKTQTPS